MRITKTFLAILAVASIPGEVRCESTLKPKSPRTLPSCISKEIVAAFEARTLSVPDGEGFSEMQYRLFKPVISAGKQYPLLLVLNGHGTEQFKYINIGQLKHLEDLIFHQPTHREKYPFFVVAPQCIKTADDVRLPWVSTGAGDGESADSIEAALRIVDAVAADHPVDLDKVTVLGISAGGTAAWDFAIRHPDRFAAIVPLGSFPDNANADQLSRLKDVSVWAFHSSDDKPEPVRRTVARLNAQGADCRLTEIPTGKHDCWDEAFGYYDLLNWMLAQRRGAERDGDSDMLGTSIEWQLAKHRFLTRQGWRENWATTWPRAVPLAVIVTIGVARHRHFRRTPLTK